MVTRYRKKPDTVEALQWTGDNRSEFEDWLKPYLQFTITVTTLRHQAILELTSYDTEFYVYPGQYVTRSPSGVFRIVGANRFHDFYEEEA